MIEIVRIPVLSDNYVWLAHEPESGETMVVDPAVEARPPQDQCTAIENWEFTLGTGYQSRAVPGVWGALSKVTGPFSPAVVTKKQVPLRDSDGEGQWQDFLVSEAPLQDEIFAEDEERQVRRALLTQAMESLNDREKHILAERRLAEEPKTLEELSQVYGVSRERIRQIEVRAFEKLQSSLLRLAGDRRLLPAA